MVSFIRKTLFIIFLFACILMSISAQAIKERNTYVIEVTDLSPDIFTTKFGHLKTTGTAEEFVSRGFAWGDIVKVSFLDQILEMPVICYYTDVPTGKTALIMDKDSSGKPKGNIQLVINMGDFTSTYGIADKTEEDDKTWYWTAREGVEFPLAIRIDIKEKGGYLREYQIHDLQRTDNREDYSHKTDEQYANFRKIDTTGMHGKLYRSSSPINTSIGRNTFADNACREYGVTVAINLEDSRSDAENHEGFEGSYYSTMNVVYLNLSMNFQSSGFRNGLAEGFRFMISNPGIYVIHCEEGKDRTGFMSAVLECLMGASAEEVVEDYMDSFDNFYGVEKGTEKYKTIVEENIVEIMQKELDVADFYSADLASAAEGYLRSIGLSSEEIQELKANL